MPETCYSLGTVHADLPCAVVMLMLIKCAARWKHCSCSIYYFPTVFSRRELANRFFRRREWNRYGQNATKLFYGAWWKRQETISPSLMSDCGFHQKMTMRKMKEEHEIRSDYFNMCVNEQYWWVRMECLEANHISAKNYKIIIIIKKQFVQV